MALYNPTYQQDPYEGLSDEERRRRQLEDQARAQAQDQENGLSQRNPDPSFGDIAGMAFDRRMGSLEDRLNTAKGYFTDPGAALQQRLGVPPANQPEAEATPVKQTITTDPETGEQKVKIEGSARDLSAANPLTPTIVGPVSPEQQAQQEQQMAQQMAQYRVPPTPARTMAPPPGMAPPGQAPQGQPGQAPSPMSMAPRPPAAVAPGQMPTTLPAQGTIPAAAANQAVEIPGLPKIGPAVKLAGPMSAVSQQQLATQPAPATATAPATAPAAAAPPPAAEAPWIRAANDAGTDFLKLAEVANKFPESRDFIIDKLKSTFKNQSLQDDANKIVKGAEAGNLKDWNKMQQAIRPETGKPKEEVTVNDYLKAYMYKRLGLDALALDVQNKISGNDTEFGQVSIGGTNWQVERNKKTGQIDRAKDNEGNIATESTLNQIRAAGMKTGTHAFGFTGEAAVIPAGQPDAGQEYRQRTNAITGDIENVITSGPNANKIYGGPPGLARSVGTAAAKATDAKQISLAYDPIIDAAKRGAGYLGEFNAKYGTNFNILGYGQNREPIVVDRTTNQVLSKNDQGVVTTTSTGPGKPGQAAAPAGTAANPTVRVISGGGGKTPAQIQQSMELGKKQVEANIDLAKEVAAAEQKVPAEAKGKVQAKDINNQNFADSSYGLLKPIADLIKKSTGSGIGSSVDSLAAVFGKGTEGAQAIANLEPLTYPLLANVPRFEGAQSDYDVKTYQKAAGDFANPEKPIATRLAALQGMITLLKKYDKAGTNDWSFGGTGATGGTTSTNVKFKVIQ